MKAGNLRHLLQIESPVKTQDATGDEIVTWSTVATVWGSVEPVGGREFYNRDQIRDDVDTRIIVRWSPTIETLDQDWRIRHQSTIYNIKRITHIKLQQREIEIMCSSGLNEG